MLARIDVQPVEREAIINLAKESLSQNNTDVNTYSMQNSENNSHSDNFSADVDDGNYYDSVKNDNGYSGYSMSNNAVDVYENVPAEIRLLKDFETDFVKMQEMFDNALVESIENSHGEKAVNGGGEVKFEIRDNFANEIQDWFDNTTNEERKESGKRFLVGTTTAVLKSIGVNDYKIYFGGAKIIKILNDNSSMNLDIIKKAVYLLENPILIMQSQTVQDSVVIFGEVYTTEDKPVMTSLLLNPKNKNGELLDYSVITSAYGRRISNLQNLIYKSEIYYVNEQKERTNKWLKALGLQLPSALTKYGSISSISNNSENVNSNIENILFDDEFYSQFENEDKQKITESIDELKKKLNSLPSDADFFDVFAIKEKIKTLEAGYESPYEYYVEKQKANIIKEYDHNPKKFEEKLEKKKKADEQKQITFYLYMAEKTQQILLKQLLMKIK